jgi:acyl carrier protein
MKTYDIIKNILYLSIDEVNQQLLEEQRINKEIDTILIGGNAMVDSMALINLIVAVEEKVSEKFQVNIILVDERAMSEEMSPFKTVGSFINYVSVLLEEQGVK